MAILNKIRQRSLILILVIALALFAFVIQGVIDNPNAFSDTQGVVASVNGEDIDRESFQQKVKNYQDQTGGRVSSTQAMNAIYNEEVRKIIMDNEYEALGLSVEKDEMRDLLKNSFQSYQEFQDENGNFDVNRLNGFIANLKELNGETAQLGTILVNYESWTSNEQAIASRAVQASYFNLIKSGIGTTISEAKDEYNSDAKNVDVRFVQIPYTTIADSLVEVTSADIKAYMDDRKDQFKAEANREVIYVEFKEEASAADEDALKAELMKLKSDSAEYNESSGNTDTIPGFDTVKDVEGFINANSDINYNDKFLIKSQLPAEVADSLINLPTDGYSNIYRFNGHFNLSKVVEAMEVADSVKHSHIIVPYLGSRNAGPDITRTRDEAKAVVDSLLPLVQNNKAKFNEVASEINTDGSKNTNGEVGWTRLTTFNPNSFDPDYADYIFYNPEGKVDIVETQFGYHIIRIDESKNYEKAIKLATLARKIEPSDQTLQEVFNKMSKFEIALKDGDFQDLAAERKLTVKPITFKELDENIPGLGSQRQVVRWAFEDATDVGDYKNFSISGFGFIVAKVVEKNDEGLMSVEDASITVIPEIRKEKKAQMIREKITATTIDEIAKNQNQGVKTAAALTLKNTTLAGAGTEPKVIGAAFGLEQGVASKLIDGEKGVYVIEVTKITEATALENYTSYVNRLNTTLRNSVQSKVYQALQEAADIEDNRAKTVY